MQIRGEKFSIHTPNLRWKTHPSNRMRLKISNESCLLLFGTNNCLLTLQRNLFSSSNSCQLKSFSEELHTTLQMYIICISGSYHFNYFTANGLIAKIRSTIVIILINLTAWREEDSQSKYFDTLPPNC